MPEFNTNGLLFV